jgi:hypothetical protein
MRIPRQGNRRRDDLCPRTLASSGGRAGIANQQLPAWNCDTGRVEIMTQFGG